MSEKDTPGKGPSTQQIADVLGAMVGTLKDISDETKKRQKLTVNEIFVKTPFDPKGSLGGQRAVRLKWEHVYQNGQRCNPALLTDEEIDLLNTFKKSGRYNKGKWGARVRKHTKELDISYPNSTVAHRLELTRDAMSATTGTAFAGMLQKILIEQEAREQARRRGEDLDDED